MPVLPVLVATLSLAAASPSRPAPARIAFRAEPDRVVVTVGGEPLTAFHHGKAWPKPFLHPLRTPAGVVISRGFPLTPAPGESSDHVWHRGLWFAHGSINGLDFWNEPKADAGAAHSAKFGSLVLRGAPRTRVEGPRGVLTATMDMVTAEKQVLGSVALELTFSRVSGHNVIDVRTTVAADKGTPLTFRDSKEGTVGVRLTDGFRVDRGATLMNSEGVRGKEIWGKRARWVDYATSLEGRPVGLTFMDAPFNLRHPTHWHARDYGLCAANPFGARYFEKKDHWDSSYTIEPGATLSLRHRVVLRDGALAPPDIEALYQDMVKSARPR